MVKLLILWPFRILSIFLFFTWLFLFIYGIYFAWVQIDPIALIQDIISNHGSIPDNSYPTSVSDFIHNYSHSFYCLLFAIVVLIVWVIYKIIFRIALDIVVTKGISKQHHCENKN